MRVSDTSIQATSGTMSAHESIDVTVTTNAEFIQMMGTNLYSNQLLAAFREPCCNGWDSHIASGNTHIPMKITLDSDNVLTIRDYGTGIPHNMIGKIYGTYGESTKRNSTKETGGFGLGSKAPFAAVDSFRVTSWHGGKRCTYNMVKSDINKNGMPSITPTVVDVPCGDETGLAVHMHLTDDQAETARNYIPTILHTGGMEYELNLQGAICKSKNMRKFLSPAPGSYELNPDIPRDYCRSPESIFVRYGTVIYPVMSDPSTEKAVQLLQSFLTIIDANSIVVQAEAGTLGLIPSREGFTRSELTSKGTVKMCLDLVNLMEKEIQDELPQAMKDAVRKAKAVGGASIGSGKSCNHGLSTFMAKDLHVRYMQSRLYPKGEMFKFKEKLHNVFCQAQSENTRKELGNRGFNILRKIAAAKVQRKPLSDPLQTYERKNIVKPAYRAVLPILNLLPNKLKSCELRTTNRYMYDIYHGGINAKTIKTLLPGNIEDKISFILYSNGKRLHDSMCHYPDRKDFVGMMFIRLPVKKDDRQAVVDYFKSTDLTVVNLTEEHDWDVPRKREEHLRQLRKATKPDSVRQAKPGVDRAEDEYLSGISLGSWLDQNIKRYGSRVRGQVIKFSPYTSSSISSVVKGKRPNNPKYFLVPLDLDKRGNRSKERPDLFEGVKRYFPYWLMSREEIDSTVIIRSSKDLDYVIRNNLTSIADIMFNRLYQESLKPEFLEYLKKYRQLKLQEKVTRNIRVVLNEMGVKVPGIDRMVYNPEMEKVFATIREIDTSKVEKAVSALHPDQPTLDFASHVRNCLLLSREDTPATKLVTYLSDYSYLDDISWVDDWKNGLAENKPVLKLMVKTAIKLGKSR